MHKNFHYENTWITKHGYENGVVFQINNVVSGDTYVGSTRSPLKKRLAQTISSAKIGKAGALYDSIREHGKECFEIEEVYECSPYDNPKEEVERYILEINPSLNKEVSNNSKINKNSGELFFDNRCLIDIYDIIDNK